MYVRHNSVNVQAGDKDTFWRIEWCDRRLCHVTGNTRIRGWSPSDEAISFMTTLSNPFVSMTFKTGEIAPKNIQM